MQRRIKFLVQLLFGVVLVFVWLRFIDLELLSTYLSQINFNYILLLFIFGFLAGLVRLTRLRVVLTPLVKVPIVPLYLIGFAANLFNFLLAMRAGELTKGYYLKKLYGSSFVKATSAVVVDRAADFLIIVFTVLVIGLLGRSDLFSPAVLAIIFILPLVVLYLLAWEGTRLFSFCESLMLRINLPRHGQILNIFDNLIKGFGVARRSPGTLLLIFFLSFLALILDAVGLSFMFKAFSVNASFLSVLLANSLFALSFLIPSPPAYIGTVEIAGSLIFILVLGLEKNLAASIALFFHAYSAFVVGILGLPALVILHLKLLKHGKG